jgi:succinate dehydrogenase/fumarate reductase cytochrome b subunit
MTTIKNVSKNSFAWGHFGVILFHFIIGLFLIFNNSKIYNIEIKKFLKPLGIILIIISLLALWPIFAYYDKDYEYVINMN